MFAQDDGVVLFIVGYQLVIAALLDVNIAVDYEDANVADVHRVALLDENLVAVVEGRLHAVTTNGDHKIRLLCNVGFGNQQFFCKLAVQEVAGAGGCRQCVVIDLQHTQLGLLCKGCHTLMLALNQIVNNFLL